MNRILICISLAFAPAILSAQVATEAHTGVKANVSPNLSLSDISSGRERPDWTNSRVKGSPFLIEDWKYGLVTLSDNRSVERVRVKINCTNNKVHYLQDNEGELVAAAGLIRQIVVLDTTLKGIHPYVFASGYPPIDHQNEASFYEKKVSGKAELLIFTNKRIRVLQTGGGQEEEYMTEESTYLYKNGQIREWKKGKESLIEFLSDKKDAIADFINSQKLKCKTIDEVKKVLEYYNSLS